MSAADLCWHVVNCMLKARVPLDAKQSNALLLPQLQPEPGEVITRRIGGPRGLLHGPNLQGMHPLALRLWRLLQQHSGFTMSPASCLVVEGGVFALCVAEGGWVHTGPSEGDSQGNNNNNNASQDTIAGAALLQLWHFGLVATQGLDEVLGGAQRSCAALLYGMGQGMLPQCSLDTLQCGAALSVAVPPPLQQGLAKMAPLATPATFGVPDNVPVFLESCFGVLRRQAYMQGLAHLMRVFNQCMYSPTRGWAKATCMWVSCASELEGEALIGFNKLFLTCQGKCGNVGSKGKHKVVLGRDQSHPLATQEELPGGFCRLALAWMLTLGPAAATLVGPTWLLCLYEGLPVGSWQGACSEHGVWHVALSWDQPTHVDWENKTVKIQMDLGPDFTIEKVLRAVFVVSGLCPAGLCGVCASPPCTTFSTLDFNQTQNNIYRDHGSCSGPQMPGAPSHPAKQDGSWGARVAQHADAMVINLLAQCPSFTRATRAITHPYYGCTEYAMDQLAHVARMEQS